MHSLPTVGVAVGSFAVAAGRSRWRPIEVEDAIEENVGNWKEDTRTFEWKTVNGKPGMSKQAVTRLIGNNSIQSHIVAEDENGKSLVDLTIRSTRKK